MYNKLRADYAKCDTLRFTNSSGSTIAAGTWRIQGTVLGIVYDDTPDGEDGIMIVRAPAPGVLVPKATGVAFAVGARVYWDIADGNLNADSANNDAVGWAYEAAASADTEVLIVLLNSVPVA